MTEQDERIISEYAVKLKEGVLGSEEFDQLNSMIASDPDIAKYYSHIMLCLWNFDQYSIEILRSQKPVPPSLDDNQHTVPFRVPADSNTSLRGVDLSGFNLDADAEESEDPGLTKAMLELLELERTSPVVEIPKEEPKRELIQKVENDFKWFPGRPSKRKIRTLIAIAASILVTIGYLFFFGPKDVYRPVVASLADSIDAVWDNEFEIPGEFEDMVQSRYRLKKGFISILFNDGAKVTVEAPAELSLNSASDMELFSGRIYAIVPQKAHGFTVKAGSGKVVDLGTEFGVEVDSSGNTQLHVTKGSTMLFAGLLNEDTEQIKVDQGIAKKVYNDGFIKDIEIVKDKFVRRINSKLDIVLREMQFSLADVIGGGSDFGNGNKKQSIDPITGKVNSDFVFELREGKNRYSTLDDMTCVDGVFVPDGGEGPIEVSSEGDMFENCIDTSGGCYRNITNYFRKDPGVEESMFRDVMNGVKYGTSEKPAISMHSNTGITFDLDSIRKSIPDVRVASFSALCGIAGKINQMMDYKATFYVLIDGKKKFEISGLHKELLDIPVRIELSEQDRFLTLIAADGGDTSGRDWCMFAMPTLELVGR